MPIVSVLPNAVGETLAIAWVILGDADTE